MVSLFFEGYKIKLNEMHFEFYGLIVFKEFSNEF